MEEDFRRAWSEMTKLILKECGSLGSRLHRSEDGSWIAYAQWPSREQWENANVQAKEAAALRQTMQACTESKPGDFFCEMTDDFLIPR